MACFVIDDSVDLAILTTQNPDYIYMWRMIIGELRQRVGSKNHHLCQHKNYSGTPLIWTLQGQKRVHIIEVAGLMANSVPFIEVSSLQRCPV